MTEKVLVTPAELSEMLKSEAIVLIDTRSPDSYAAGHLPGEVNLREIFSYLAISTPEGGAAMRDKFTAVRGRRAGRPGDGGGLRGGHGLRLRPILPRLGPAALSRLPKVQILHGGYAGWTAAGLPITTVVRADAADVRPRSESRRHARGPAGHAGRGPRSQSRQARRARWRGMDRREFVPVRQGILPAQGSDSRGRLDRVAPDDEADTERSHVQVDPDAILAECARRGISPETPVVLYCFKGASASNTMVALNEAGIRNVQALFRLLERVVARSGAADRRGASL